MNEILKFDRVYYEKYNTSRINIENGILVLKEHCEILKIDGTKYSYTGENAAQKIVEMLERDIREITSIPEKTMIFEKKKKNDWTRKLNVGYAMEHSMMMLKKVRLETIVILVVGIEAPHTTRVILIIENLILRLWCFITLVGMIATYL